MFEVEQGIIKDFRKRRSILNIVFTLIKLLIAYALISYIDYGLFIVIGYLLYSLENTMGLQFINSQEIDLQLNMLNQRINELENDRNKT